MGRRASVILQSAARDLQVLHERWAMQYLLAECCAICGPLRRSSLAAFSRTTIGGWHVRGPAPVKIGRSGSALFCLEQIQDLEDQLDDAVAFERGQRDQLGCGCNHNPEGWVTEEVHKE